MNSKFSEKLTQALARFPRQAMSLLPTPVYRLEQVSAHAGANIYCKRDDLTGFAFGGNKTRKLDYLLADAVAQGANTLVAIGANQSNFCRMAAGAGAVNGLEVHLVLGGTKPKTPTGNLRVDHLLGAKVHHVDTADWDEWFRAADDLANELRGEGRKVYAMPVGGSTPIGTLGYAAAFAEIMADSARLGIDFDWIIHASSSAGTQAGLVVGQAMTGWRGKIVGMGVAGGKEYLEQHVHELASQTGELLSIDVPRELVIVDDAYMGETYGAHTKEAARAIELFAQSEGILLDCVYTGKAAAGMLDYAARGKFGDDKVLFIHTGGNIELFE